MMKYFQISVKFDGEWFSVKYCSFRTEVSEGLDYIETEYGELPNPIDWELREIGYHNYIGQTKEALHG